MPRPAPKPGPRANPRYRPRGLKRWTYTWQTLADLLGVSLHTVRKYGQGRGRKFNPADLGSVVAFAQSRQVRSAEPGASRGPGPGEGPGRPSGTRRT